MDIKSELCDPGGCLAEVVELISVLLLARLVIGNLAEVGIPLFKNFIEEKFHKHHSEEVSESSSLPQYRKDYLLEELELDGVAEEYMEMIVQFAFVTLFVPAFPLAALVCFLNNIAEIRVDATNFITAHRRPLPIRVPGIQIWNEFLDVITKLAILVNAALIAFTSELLPRLFYFDPERHSSYGEFILSSIHMEDFQVPKIEEYMTKHNVTDCYYQDFREKEPPYDKSDRWWHVMIIRLLGFTAFIIIFFLFHWLFNFLVSDRPASVDMKIRRRKYVLSKATDNEIVDKWLVKKKSVQFASSNGVNQKIENELESMQNEVECMQNEMQMAEINHSDEAHLVANEQLNSIGDNSNNMEDV